MFKKLPRDYNLEIFSFLSSSNTRLLRTLNKSTQQLTNDPLIWKNLLKTEFSFLSVKGINDPEKKHKELEQKKIADDFIIKEIRIFNDRLAKEFESNPDKVYTEVAAKLDLPILLRQLLEHNKDQILLNEVLSIACRYLSSHSVKTLIELGAEVNSKDSKSFIQSPCLFLTLIAISNPNFSNREQAVKKGKEIVEILLKNAADPDAISISIPEGVALTYDDLSPKTIRDFCAFMVKSGRNDLTNEELIFKEILDLIISTPTLTTDEPPVKKMRT